MSLTFRRAKIVCTLGPASWSEAMIDQLMRAGMDVVRLNFSHGTHAEHARTIARVRVASGRCEKPIAILADLQGPKIRTGPLAQGKPIQLRAGQRFTITTERVSGNAACVSTTFAQLPREVHKNDRILLADGLIELRAVKTHRDRVDCVVINGGELGENKGINLPGVRLSVPAMTAKDRHDLKFALAHGVNWVAVSFVRTAKDVLVAKNLIRRAGKDTPVIAKLEKPEAIDNLDEILGVADGVMVARGDLGVEMSPERVPVMQKKIISRAREFRRPVITATQMLESMTQNPRPTRAEASDVANAIFDGTDAVMLSAETASGRYPKETVQMMDRIIRVAESSIREFPRPPRSADLKIAETACELITHASEELKMKVIAVFTHSGSTAQLISKYRPHTPIVAFSPETQTRRALSLIWGVLPRTITAVKSIDSLTAVAEKRLCEEKLVRRGDIIGIVAGTPMGVRGTTNFMKFHVIGELRR